MRHSQTLCVSLIAPLCWVGCLGSRDVMVNLVHWPPSSAIRPHSELLICVGGILWDIGVKGVDSPGTYQVIVGAGLCMLFFWWTLSGQRSYLLLGSQLSFPVFMELQLRNSSGKWRVDNICLLELSLLWIIGLLIIPYHSQRNMCKRKYIGNWNIWQRALDQICYWHLIRATSLHVIGGGFNCLFSLVNWNDFERRNWNWTKWQIGFFDCYHIMDQNFMKELWQHLEFLQHFYSRSKKLASVFGTIGFQSQADLSFNVSMLART